MALEQLLQAIPIEAGTTQSGIELHSGIARLYPRVYGNLVRQNGQKSEVGVIIVHPMSNFHGHHLLAPIAASGLPIIGLNTRYAGNDAAVILENCLLDIDAAIRWAREKIGWKKVILAGFSGGGPLVSMYQSQVVAPSIKATPAGDPPDLTRIKLERADALLLIASSPSRSQMMIEFIDPSVTDENDPLSCDQELNLYHPDRKAPFDRSWVNYYRQAQRARVKRIEEWVVSELARLSALGVRDRAFVVHRTVADPRALDLTIDPSEREIGTIWGDPRTANQAPGPMGRFSTLRSWLSTWSPTYSNGDALKNLAKVDVPVGIVSLTADQASLPVHAEALRDATPRSFVDYMPLRGLTHYFYQQPDAFEITVSAINEWRKRWDLAA